MASELPMNNGVLAGSSARSTGMWLMAGWSGAVDSRSMKPFSQADGAAVGAAARRA